MHSFSSVKGMCDFSPHEISSHDTFSLNPDPNHNPNPNTNRNTNSDPNRNPNSPMVVPCIRIKGRGIKCREVNYLVPVNSIDITFELIVTLLN